MRKIFRNLGGIALFYMSLPAMGQGLSEAVTVEGRYTPEVRPADRLALQAATIALSAPESPMT